MNIDRMSKANNKAILADIKAFLDGNDSITKKDFLKAVGEAFDKNKVAKPKTLKMKGKAKEEDGEDIVEKVMNKKVKKDNLKPDGEEKPKRKLSDYQQFAKEQLAFLKQREDAKEEGEEKLKQKDLMKLVAKRWKLKKEEIPEEEWDERMNMEDE
jgi:hypothetical protein